MPRACKGRTIPHDPDTDLLAQRRLVSLRVRRCHTEASSTSSSSPPTVSWEQGGIAISGVPSRGMSPRSTQRFVRLVGMLLFAASGALTLSGESSAGNITFAAAAQQAVSSLLSVYYTGNGEWRDCNAPDCDAGNQDWGDDSLTYVLSLRYQTTHDASLQQPLLALSEQPRPTAPHARHQTTAVHGVTFPSGTRSQPRTNTRRPETRPLWPRPRQRSHSTSSPGRMRSEPVPGFGTSSRAAATIN